MIVKKNINKLLSITAIIALSFAITGQAKKEYTVKSAYIYNFMKFTTWPESSNLHSTSALNFCILGKDDLSKYVKIIAKKKIGSKKINIMSNHDPNNVKNCHAVFFGKGIKNDVYELSKKYAGMGILTMSDLPKFPYEKGMIGFYTDKSKIKFAVNIKNASKAGFKISSKLLELAKVIK